MVATNSNAINFFSPAKFVVSKVAGEGTHTTIAAALTAASSGDTIVIMPGTFTENLSLVAGVNLSAYGSDGLLSLIGSAAPVFTANVTIVGTTTASYTGRVNCSGILFQTNGATALSITGASSILNLMNCSIYAVDSTGITISNGGISLFYCTVRSASTNNLFTATGGSIDFDDSSFNLSNEVFKSLQNLDLS